jgi:hypothetical protein
MPTGRLAVFGGNAWTPRLPHSVNIRSLRRRRNSLNPPRKLSVSELRECRRILRKLVSIYRIARTTPQPTATQRRALLLSIRSAALDFRDNPSKVSAEDILERLSRCDVNTKRILYIDLLSRGHGAAAISQMREQLQDLFSLSIYPDESPPLPGALWRAACDRILRFMSEGLSVVRTLALIDIDKLVPNSGRWPDPSLANLVAGVEPIWCRVTGRTAGFVSRDKTGDEKILPFADWLGDLLENVAAPRPPYGRVIDIVRSKKTAKIRNPTSQ